MRHLAAVTLLAIGLSPHTPCSAQGLANRIARVRDGAVRFSVETRPEICGDGRSIGEETEDGFILYTAWDRGFSISTFDYWAPDCRQGPMRLVVEKAGGEVVDLRAAVAVAWRDDASGTDLGMIAGAEAARWLLDASVTTREDVSRVALLAANAAQDAGIADRLLNMVSNRNLPGHVRQGAMRWVNGAAAREGKVDAADRALRNVAASTSETTDIRERAVRQLRDTPANDRYLKDLYSQASSDLELRERIIRRLGGTDSPDNAAWVRAIALDRNERTALRERAIRVIADRTKSTDLRALFNQLDQPELKERVLRLAGERGGADDRAWITAVALDRGEGLSVRDRAIRVLSGESPSRLRDLYSRLDQVELRERVIRIAADGYDSESTAWLRSIVLNENEHATLRDRALRVLGDRDRGEARRLFDRLVDIELRERALRIAGSTRDTETASWLEGVATNRANPSELRDRALRILGDNDPGAARRLFARLDNDELRDRALRIAGEARASETATWLEGVATDVAYSIDLRDRALRLLAEQAVPSARLGQIYDRLDRHDLRERVIRLLAERSDDDAVAKLINIAENDPDRDLRRSAFRRLGDTNHPRARAFLERTVRP